jgi:hypothetical protein
MDLTKLKPHIISESLHDKIFLFYGEAGTRKTTVAAEFEGSLLAAFEIGYKFIDGVQAQPIQSWSDFKQFLRELKRDEVRSMYKTIVVDTVTLAYSACMEYVLGQYGVTDAGDLGFGKGWRAIRKEFEKSILSIPQMGYGLVLIAHADEIEEKNNIKSKVDIDKRPAAIIKGLADFIFYVRKEYKDNTDGALTTENQTVFAYNQLVEIETKTRSRYFSTRFEFTYDNLKAEMKKAIEEQKKVEGIVTVQEKEFSLHELEEEDFEQLRLDVVNLAKELLETDAFQIVEQKIITIMGPEIKLSQASKVYEPQLKILQQELLDIKVNL